MRGTLGFLVFVGGLAWLLFAWLGALADAAWEDAATWEQVPVVAECAAEGVPLDQCRMGEAEAEPEYDRPWWVK